MSLQRRPKKMKVYGISTRFRHVLLFVFLLCLIFCFINSASASNLTVDEVGYGAAEVQHYTNNNQNIPSYVSINGKNSTAASFLKTLTTTVLELNNNDTTPVTIDNNISSPSNPSGSAYGNITKAEYLTMARRVNTYITNYDVAPGWCPSSLGNVRYESLVYTFSKIMNTYWTTGSLPSTVRLVTVTGRTIGGVVVQDSTPPTVTANPCSGIYNSVQSVTLTATDNVDSSPDIYYTINGDTPTTSSTLYTTPIDITNSTSLQFIALDDAGNLSSVESRYYNIVSKEYVYSFDIPRYCNITMPFVPSAYVPSEYVVTGGFDGVVKVGVSRIICIEAFDRSYYFVNGNIGVSGVTRLYRGDLYNISSNGLSMKNDDGKIISIYCGSDTITVSYFGNLTNSVDQFSVVYRECDELGFKTADIILNGIIQASISFSTTLHPYDDLSIKYALCYLYDYNLEDYPYCSYETICNPNSTPTLKFTNTDEELVYNNDLCRIMNNPSFEQIKTEFSYDNTTISKQETVTFDTSYAPEGSQEAGFETIHSFAITNTKITEDIIEYWLGQKDQTDNNGTLIYPEGPKKAAYGTFMTALTTLWLSDKLADEMASVLNVTWDRNTLTVVMSGVTNGTGYVHTQDPSMGMNVNGNIENVMSFMLVNSMMLSEVENGVLSGAGLQVKSTLSSIISEILDGKAFLFVFDEEANRLTLMLENDERYYIIIDLETGLVLDIMNDNDFHYKGATSTDNAYCFHRDHTDESNEFIDNLLNDFINDLMDPHTAASTIGGLLLLGACVVSGPVGWGLLGLGIVLCAGGSGLFDDIYGSNPGYKNPWNWMDFGTQLILGSIGASGAESAVGPIIKNVGKRYIVSKVPIKGTLNPTRIAYLMKFGKYDILTSNQIIVRGALGKTESEQILTFSEEYLKETGISVLRDQIPV